MNVGHNEYCFALGIHLTSDHYCHDIKCPHAEICLTPPKEDK